MKYLAAAVIALALTQSPEAKAPSVTEAQRQQLQAISLRMENAQLLSQVAQLKFEKAQEDGRILVQSLQVQGYTFDPQTLTYTKLPEKK